MLGTEPIKDGEDFAKATPTTTLRQDSSIEDTVADSSLLPPMKNNSGKYAAVVLLLVAGAIAAWYFGCREEPPPPAPPPEVEKAEQAPAYEPEFELPAEEPDAGPPPEEKKRAFTRRVCNGTLDKTEILKAINAGPRKQVRACYERQLKANNTLQGILNLEITISSAGRVLGTRSGGSLKDSKVRSCVRTSARGWRFPKPTGGCVQTVVPFNLSPKR